MAKTNPAAPLSQRGAGCDSLASQNRNPKREHATSRHSTMV